MEHFDEAKDYCNNHWLSQMCQDSFGSRFSCTIAIGYAILCVVELSTACVSELQTLVTSVICAFSIIFIHERREFILLMVTSEVF